MGIYGILLFFLISLSLVAQAAKKNGNEEDVNAATKPQPKQIPFPNQVILDISNVSDRFVHNQATSAELTTFTTSPAQGNNVVEVKDGSSSIWKGDGCTEKCFSVTRHVKDGLDIIDLNIFAKSGTCSHKYFEKSGQEWKDIEKEVYDEKRPKSDTYTLQSGIEFEAKVEYKPVDNPREANQATEGAESTPQDASKNATASAPGTTQQAGQPADQPGATPQNAQVGGPSQAPQPTGQPVAQTDTSQPTAPETTDVPNPPSGVPKPEVSADTASPPDTNSVEAAAKVTESSAGADGGNTSADADPASSSDGGTPSHSTSTVGATSFDISNVDDNVVELTESEEEDGMKKRVYRMRDMSKVTLVTDGGFQFYKGDTEVKAVVSFSKDNHTFLFVQYKKMVENQWMCHFECSDGTWNPLTQEEYNTKFKQMKGLESLKHTENPYTFKTNPLPKKDESQKSQNASGQEQAKQKLEIEGIDSETFVLNKSDEGGVSVISCSSKIGKNPSSFNYKEEAVWSTTDTSFYLSKALLYYDGEIPTLALLKTKNKMNDEGTVYKYKDEKGEWKDVASETDFDKKLKELKKAKGGSQSSESGEHSENDESASDQSATEGTRSGKLSDGSQTRTTSQEDLTTITLNVKNPDEKTIEKHNLRLHDLKTPSYTAKDGYHIQKVTEGDTVICEDFPAGAFVKVTHCYREKWFDILHVYIVESDDKKDVKYFLKDHGHWNEVREEDFYDHFNALSSTEHDFREKVFTLEHQQTDEEFYINRSIKLPFAVYGTRSTTRVKEIKQNGTIWKRRKDEWCTKISIYPREGDYKLMWIVTKDPYENEEILYYSKTSGSWAKVERDEYLKDLTDAGFNMSKFNDRVTLDVARPDKLLFFEDKYNVDIVTMARYHVLPGFRISKVMDGDNIIWESTDDKFATYFRLNTRGENVSIGALFTTNTRKEHKILYYKKVGDEWTLIDKTEYYNLLAGRYNPNYTHMTKPKIVMSSFKNKQGTKMISYAFTVDNPKADLILVHGLRSSVISDYGTFDMDWSYERFGFDIFPHCSIFDDPVENVRKVSNSERYRQYFEYMRLEGMNPYDVLHRSQYEGSFLEAMNRLGYNVYGYGNQSHGFSESKTGKRCSVKNYEDYVYDVLQFVSIIKRGKFSDTTQTYDEQTVLKSVDCSRKIILLGYSMGGNMAMRALEIFYEKLEDSNAKFVDGLISVSTTLALEQKSTPWWQPWKKELVGFNAQSQSTKNACFQTPYDIGIIFERYADYNSDMLYYNKIYTKNTAKSTFKACEEVTKDANMAYYPKDLPTLLLHTTDDDTSFVKGAQGVVDHLSAGQAELSKLSGNGHHLVATHLVPVLVPNLNDWVNAKFPELKGRDKDVKLDIATVDGETFDVRDSTAEKILLKSISPKGGYRLAEVKDGLDELWTAAKYEECGRSVWIYYDGESPALATVYFAKGDGTNALRYYDKKNGKWSQVKKEDFDTVLNNMKRLASLSKLRELTLDISSVDDNTFTVEDSKGNDIPIKILTPKDGYRLAEVKDAAIEIWKVENEKEQGTVVLLYYDDEEPVLTALRSVKGDGKAPWRYYNKDDDGWTQVTKEKFEDLVNTKRVASLSKLTPTKLDISAIDDGVFNVEYSTDRRVPVKTITPEKAYRLTEVLDGQESLWKGEDDKGHSRSVWIYHDNESPVSLVVNFVKADGKNDLQYHVKDHSIWKLVEKKDFDEKMVKIAKNAALLKRSVRLDVTDVDERLFEITDSDDEGMPLRYLTPKKIYRLTDVSEKDLSMWKAYSSKEYCTEVRIRYNGNFPVLVTVTYTKDDGNAASRCYTKDDGKWKWVEKADYDAALTKMKKIVSLSRRNIKLDLGSIDDNLFTIESSKDGDVPVKTVSPKSGYRLTEVRGGQESIWNAYSQGEHCLTTFVHYYLKFPVLATIRYVKSDGNTGLKYYIKKANERWELVDEKGYDDQLTKTKSLTSVLKHRTKLDISDINDYAFTLTDSTEEGVPLDKMFPEGNHRLTVVKDGQDTIWEATNYGEFGKSVWVYYEGSSPLLAVVRLANIDDFEVSKYYDKQSGKWTQVTKVYHEIALTKMKRNVTLSKRNVRLDLGDIYASLFAVEEYQEDGVLKRTISPKSGYRLTEVHDTSLPIWKAYGYKQYCLTTWAYYDAAGAPMLAAVRYAKSDGQTVWRYYVKQNDGHWEWVDECVHDERLEELKKPFPTSLKDDTDLQKVEELLSGLSLEEQGQLSAKEPTLPIVLDLAAPTNPAIDVREVISDDRVKSKYYYQLGKIFFSVILDDSIEVWKAEGEERCILAYTICRDRKTYLYLLVKNGHTTSFVEYEKGIDGVWTKVDRRKTPPVTRASSSSSLRGSQDDKVAEEVLQLESLDPEQPADHLPQDHTVT